MPVLGDEPEPDEPGEEDRPRSRPAPEREGGRPCEHGEPDVPLVHPAPEHVDAHAEGIAVELDHRHRVAYRRERRGDKR